MVSEANDLEQALRQNLTLRRQLGAVVANAKNSSARESGGSQPSSTAEGAQPPADRLEQPWQDLNHQGGMDAGAAAERTAQFQYAEFRDLGTGESLAARVIWKAWVIVGVVSLALAVFMALWMIYA